MSARPGADRIPSNRSAVQVAGPARVCDHALMSMTTTIQVGERGFWATKDAFGAWMGYLVEEIADRAPALLDPALSALAEQWRVAAVVTDRRGSSRSPLASAISPGTLTVFRRQKQREAQPAAPQPLDDSQLAKSMADLADAFVRGAAEEGHHFDFGLRTRLA
jgi:hypothetical protein